MTLYEYYDRQIPEYYPTMYLDGYKPYQILQAAHRKIYSDYLACKEEQEIPVFTLKTEVKVK